MRKKKKNRILISPSIVLQKLTELGPPPARELPANACEERRQRDDEKYRESVRRSDRQVLSLPPILTPLTQSPHHDPVHHWSVFGTATDSLQLGLTSPPPSIEDVVSPLPHFRLPSLPSLESLPAPVAAVLPLESVGLV